MLGMDDLSPEDRRLVGRARRLENFLTRPFFVTESFTGTSGQRVPMAETVDGVAAIVEGSCDSLPEGERGITYSPFVVAGEDADGVLAALDQALATPDAELAARRSLGELEERIVEELRRRPPVGQTGKNHP